MLGSLTLFLLVSTRHLLTTVLLFSPLQAKSSSVKLDIYRNFSNALAVAVIASVVWIRYELPRWQETAEGARDRYLEVIQSLADKYPSENLLLVTHESIRGIYPNIHLVIIQTQLQMLPHEYLKPGEIESLVPNWMKALAGATSEYLESRHCGGINSRGLMQEWSLLFPCIFCSLNLELGFLL